MTDDGLRALSRELKARPPRELGEALGADSLHELADALGEARRRQAEALDAASERALNQIPRVLRGTVKRIVLR